jgi:hypothetical protein
MVCMGCGKRKELIVAFGVVFGWEGVDWVK